MCIQSDGVSKSLFYGNITLFRAGYYRKKIIAKPQSKLVLHHFIS